MDAGFYPQDERLDPLWRYASQHNLPVLLHTGTTFVANAPIDCTLPRHLDPVAIRSPDVKIILAHLGHPYEGETIAVIRKHANLYADVSALFYRPWQLFHSLMLVHEYNVWEKLLFGTDYPSAVCGACATCRSIASPCRRNKSRGSYIATLSACSGYPTLAVRSRRRRGEPDNRWRGRRWREP